MLHVWDVDTVDVVKAKIQDEEDIPRDQRHLTFNGEPLSGWCRLSDYNIQTSATLHLRTLEQIFVKTLMGETTTMYVEDSDNIGYIKAKIQDKFGIPWDQQCLLITRHP